MELGRDGGRGEGRGLMDDLRVYVPGKYFESRRNESDAGRL